MVRIALSTVIFKVVVSSVVRDVLVSSRGCVVCSVNDAFIELLMVVLVSVVATKETSASVVELLVPEQDSVKMKS